LEAFFGHADTLQEDPTIESLWLTRRTVYRRPKCGSNPASVKLMYRGR
jgi:hypothetical protein